MPTAWPSSLPDPTPLGAELERDMQLRAWQPEAGPPKIRRVAGLQVVRQTFRVVVDGAGYDTLMGYLQTVLAGDLQMDLPAPDGDGTQTWALDASPVRHRVTAGAAAHAARRYEVTFTAWRLA